MRRPPRSRVLLLAGVALASGAYGAQSDTPAPAPAPAATAAPQRPAGNAPIGRFFFSPSERAQLDVARMQRKAPTAAAPEAVEAPPAPQVVTYGGLVRRSDGRQMIWLNNQLVDAREGLAGLSLKGKVRPDGAVTLQSQSGGTVDVKVGQSVEVYTGKVAEARKPPPETAKPGADANAPADETKSAEAKPPAAEAKPASPTAKPPAVDNADKKAPPGGTGLKMDLGGRALSTEEAERISRSK